MLWCVTKCYHFLAVLPTVGLCLEVMWCLVDKEQFIHLCEMEKGSLYAIVVLNYIKHFHSFSVADVLASNFSFNPFTAGYAGVLYAGE